MSQDGEQALTPVGFIRGGFEARFGTPRQPGLVPAARAELHLQPPFDAPESLRGLDDYSHVWLLFGFHGVAGRGWSTTVRPPRLGGNRRLGVFATRSPFRPNGLGLSVVRLVRLLLPPGPCGLVISGQDLIAGTPVYDIKPYLPYADAPAGAHGAAAFEAPPQRLPVRFSPAAATALQGAPPGLRPLITETLALDPRPAYRGAEQGRRHGTRLGGHEVHWRVDAHGVLVETVMPAE